MKSGFLAFWLCGLAALSACDNSTSQPTGETEPASVQSSKPILSAAGLDIVPIIENVGSPWVGNPLLDNSRYDDGVGLQRRNVFFTDGSITVDREEYGGAHMIVLQSGGASNCGDAAPLRRAYAALSGALKITPPSSQQLASMDAAWQARDGWFEFAQPGLTTRALGGCRKKLLIKATA